MNALSQDPLLESTRAERLHYATGQLLGADDFALEQTYHRRQLARALLFLHGSGTIAGLRVLTQHQVTTDGEPEVELKVEPGLALDCAGRLIEVVRPACLRLRRWFDYGAAQAAGQDDLDLGDLRGAWRADAGAAAGGAVVADVFLAFHPCDRGYTPAFASGPFDALDASQPSRVRDAYQLSLVPRSEADADLPVASNPWSVLAGADPAARLAAAQALSLDLWKELEIPPGNHRGDWREKPAGTDPTSVLLARLRLPAAPPSHPNRAPLPDWSVTAWPASTANLSNDVRNVLLSPAALLQVIGV